MMSSDPGIEPEAPNHSRQAHRRHTTVEVRDLRILNHMMSNYPLTCVCTYDVQCTLAMRAGLWIGEEIYREDIAVTCVATPEEAQ
jgi:hypothetical protein